MKVIWGLYLLCLAGGLRGVHAGPVRKTSKMKDKAAPQDEVNVLMFGVIQFSESLNYVYETTEAKIAKISQVLKSHEATLQNLGRQTEQAADVEKQMKEVIQLLQVRKHTEICKQRTTHVPLNGCVIRRKIVTENYNQTADLKRHNMQEQSKIEDVCQVSKIPIRLNFCVPQITREKAAERT